MFIDDLFADFLKLVTLFRRWPSCWSTAGEYLAETRNLDKGEFYLLVMFATLGMMVMISASHFLTIYLGLELLALSLYALVAIDRDNPPAPPRRR
jgi:NADH-quinone oxidoreductase subunit N